MQIHTVCDMYKHLEKSINQFDIIFAILYDINK